MGNPGRRGWSQHRPRNRGGLAGRLGSAGSRCRTRQRRRGGCVRAHAAPGQTTQRTPTPAGARLHGRAVRRGPAARGMTGVSVRPMYESERRLLVAARLVAVTHAPYLAHALFTVSPVAAEGLGTFAVDRSWRL